MNNGGRLIDCTGSEIQATFLRPLDGSVGVCIAKALAATVEALASRLFHQTRDLSPFAAGCAFLRPR
ncbi:hypothetical protein SNOG_20153 [Parastagonospora nodorum SN15]|uniref:Uncharacterized protein n=1 Tax=Phaeosphaeria nodorum (strain SN15 / ATCC MYA-4574 / FGSC 10173) TaxID=321614 RepID=A9JXE9_PHANO|nr:hypothetical protein SNOG_20153 [Parastagonospora nodorum SN15]EDP89839.1 hypothetical protein SNOG_20153 [Parastagonospora nodorum SN15]